MIPPFLRAYLLRRCSLHEAAATDGRAPLLGGLACETVDIPLDDRAMARAMDMQTDGAADPLRRVVPGDSEMARRMRALDRSVTPLGPLPGWQQNLRVALGICLTSQFPMPATVQAITFRTARPRIRRSNSTRAPEAA
jgi:hypothetical protein